MANHREGCGPWTWIGCGCGGCLLLVILVVGFVVAAGGVAFLGIRKSDVYEEAVERAKAHPQVLLALGEPIETGLLTSGSFSISGTSGEADLSIPISGPEGKGRIYAVATKRAGEWEFTLLEVEIEATGERIDLLAVELVSCPAERPAGFLLWPQGA